MAEAVCPQCGKAVGAAQFAPFCSARCKQIDLGRWLKGGYVIPGKPDQDGIGSDGLPVGDAADEE